MGLSMHLTWDWGRHSPPNAFAPIALLKYLAVPAGLAVVSWFLSLYVNVNRFSLHGFYRNRLV